MTDITAIQNPNRVVLKIMSAILHNGGWIESWKLTATELQVVKNNPQWFDEQRWAWEVGYALTKTGREVYDE